MSGQPNRVQRLRAKLNRTLERLRYAGCICKRNQRGLEPQGIGRCEVCQIVDETYRWLKNESAGLVKRTKDK